MNTPAQSALGVFIQSPLKARGQGEISPWVFAGNQQDGIFALEGTNAWGQLDIGLDNPRTFLWSSGWLWYVDDNAPALLKRYKGSDLTSPFNINSVLQYVDANGTTYALVSKTSFNDEIGLLKYNPATDEWDSSVETPATPPTAISNPIAWTRGNSVYYGGYDIPGSPNSIFGYYLSFNNFWSQQEVQYPGDETLGIPSPRSSVTSQGGTVYFGATRTPARLASGDYLPVDSDLFNDGYRWESNLISTGQPAVVGTDLYVPGLDKDGPELGLLRAGGFSNFALEFKNATVLMTRVFADPFVVFGGSFTDITYDRDGQGEQAYPLSKIGIWNGSTHLPLGNDGLTVDVEILDVIPPGRFIPATGVIDNEIETLIAGDPYSRQLDFTDVIAYALVDAPDGMTLAQDGLLEWDPTVEGVHFVEVYASAEGGYDIPRWTLDVLAPGDAPVITPIPDGSHPVGVSYSLLVTYNQGTQPITLTLEAGPPGSLIIGSNVVWPAGSVVAGSHFFEIKASNVYGEDTESWTLTVS